MKQTGKILTIIFVFACVCSVSQAIFGQTIVRRQDFDGVPNNSWGAFNETGSSMVTANGAVAGTTNPANATYGSTSAANTTQIPNNDAASTGKGTENGNLVLTSPNIPPADFAGNNDLYISFRIAAIGRTAIQGMDAGDTIAVRISLDNAAFSEEAIVRGDTGAAWNYTVTGAPIINYDGNGAVEAGKIFQAVGGSSNDTNSVTKLTLRIPDALLNGLTIGVRIRVELTSDPNELWVVDDFIAYTNVVTAAQVSVGGRVSTPDGQGISRAAVIITAPSGQTRQAITNPFGYYRFDEIQSGEAYVLEVRHKQYNFAPRVWVADQTREDFDFSPQFKE
ncbi:MAG TPA: carboxypeptidase-like regulatory domain-containing protein [Pyrinomonadaceae bacterium]|jgi:hypothetical protein